MVTTKSYQGFYWTPKVGSAVLDCWTSQDAGVTMRHQWDNNETPMRHQWDTNETLLSWWDSTWETSDEEEKNSVHHHPHLYPPHFIHHAPHTPQASTAKNVSLCQSLSESELDGPTSAIAFFVLWAKKTP